MGQLVCCIVPLLPKMSLLTGAGSSGAAAAEANATKQAGSSVFNADAAAFVPRWLRHAQVRLNLLVMLPLHF